MSTPQVPLTRREIARAAIKAIWEWQEAGCPLMSQEDLADEIGVVSGETVGNALTAFGDEEVEKLPKCKGHVWVWTEADGYRITERLNTNQLAMTVGMIQCELTKNRKATTRLNARRNPSALKQVAVKLAEARGEFLKPALADAEGLLKNTRKREQRRRAAVRAGRKGPV
jgi:hypothetical protein